MRITVTTNSVTAGFASRLAAFPAKSLRAMVKGLNEGGDKLRTRARKDLREQTGVTKYGTITAHTGQRRATAGSLEYSVLGLGKGLAIREFPVSAGVGAPVTAKPWGVTHRFARSFQTKRKGLLLARRGAGRFPVRSLRGPSVAKEIVKGETAADFTSHDEPFVLGPVIKRLGRLLP